MPRLAASMASSRSDLGEVDRGVQVRHAVVVPDRVVRIVRAQTRLVVLRCRTCSAYLPTSVITMLDRRQPW